MNDLRMKRTLAAIFSSLMLSASIVVFAGNGPCVKPNVGQFVHGGWCELDPLDNSYYCTVDHMSGVNCNGPTSSTLMCHIGSATLTKTLWGASGCGEMNSRCYNLGTYSSTDIYAYSDGACPVDGPPN